MGLLFCPFEFCQEAGYAAKSESPHRNRVASKLRTPKKNLIRKAENKRHRSLTNQKSFRLIGFFRRGSLASWQALLSDRHSKSRDTWLTIAALAAIACPAVVHRAIFAAGFTSRLICRKSNRANHRRENRKQNFNAMFHTDLMFAHS
jgi:hypothetical protein